MARERGCYAVRCLGVALVLAAGSAAADPLIAGCCDSITSEFSYLDLVWDDYGWPSGGDPYYHNLGVDASLSSAGLSRLQSYLAWDDPDAVIVLSGTPDTFLGPSWPVGTYNPRATVREHRQHGHRDPERWRRARPGGATAGLRYPAPEAWIPRAP